MTEHKLFLIIVLILNCFISAFSQVLLKKASLKNYDSFFRQYLNPYVIIGYGVFFIVLCVNIFMLKYLPLSVVNPVAEALPIVLSFVAGKLVFNEKISKFTVAGAVLIICGIVLILI